MAIKFVDASTTYVEVSEETIEDVEQSYEYLRENPGKKGLAEFDSMDERRAWLKEARAYVKDRAQGTLTLRLLPGKGLPETSFYFSLKPEAEDIAANGAARGRRGE